MKKLGFAYLMMIITTGLFMFAIYIWSLPDGKLYITFCNVGQGDAAYVRFPDGRVMLVDGGPNDNVLACLGRQMPFWDRSLDLMVMTHPQQDHMGGLVPVLERYRVAHVVRSDVTNTEAELYRTFLGALRRSGAEVHLMTAGRTMDISGARLTVLWPSEAQIALMHPGGSDVLGATTGDLNDASVVIHLEYGDFDAVLTGDADTHVNGKFTGADLGDDPVEILKVPHHGSKTGMTEAFLSWLKPQLAVISVGKNTYGHPAEETLEMLKRMDIPVRRTDRDGDVTVVTDGHTWRVTGAQSAQ